MYHDVVAGDQEASGFRGAGAARYKLSWPAFIAHLDGISRAVADPPDIAGALLTGAAPRSWSLTFDDGGASTFSAGEELARRNWRGHFFIVTNRIGDTGFLDASAIRELREMGHVIGSHTASHPSRLTSLTDEEIAAEWRSSLTVLSDLLGETVDTASVPGGYYATRVAVAASKAGVAVLFTSEPGRTARRVDTCLVVGRLSVRANTSVREVASAAAGHWRPWFRQYAGWNLRKPMKALLAERYEDVVARYERARPSRRSVESRAKRCS